MTITVLTLGGTWAATGHPVTDAFHAGLGAGFDCRMVPYTASYGDPDPYADSREDGYDRITLAAYDVDGPIVLAGYSQGAWGAGRLAAEVGRGEHPDLNVVGAALIADPERPKLSNTVGPNPGGYGIAGERAITGLPVWWAAADHDPITALPAGNPLRSIADLSTYYSLTSLEAVAQWGASMLEAAIRGQLQPWWHPQHWRDWGGAIEYAAGYLGTRHTFAYVEEGLSQLLGETVAAAVG